MRQNFRHSGIRVMGYLKTGNASEAYRQAYAAKDMKAATINRKAKDLLDNGKIAARLAELNQSAVTDSVMTRQRALERLSLIAETSITDILEFDQREIEGPEGPVSETIWRMKDSVEIPEVAAATIKSVTMTKFTPISNSSVHPAWLIFSLMTVYTESAIRFWNWRIQRNFTVLTPQSVSRVRRSGFFGTRT
jgi:hypothetical protein